MTSAGRQVPWAIQALLFSAGVFLILSWRLPVRPAVYWSIGLGVVLAGGRGAAGHGRRQLAEAARVDLARRRESSEFKDGDRIAVIGSLEPAATVVNSALRGEPCVAYYYQAYHYESRTGESSTEVFDYSGLGIVPLSVRTDSSSIAIGGYPWTADFPPLREITSEEEMAKGRRALAFLRFEDVSESALTWIEQRQKEWTGRSPLIKHYRRLRGKFDISGPVRSFEELHLRERVIPAGLPVCAIGIWSSDRRALIGTGDGIERELWIWSGRPAAVHERIIGSSAHTRGCGWFLIVVSLGIMVWLLRAAT